MAYINMEDYSLYKKQAIEAAEDLHYGDEVIEKIEKATSNGEIERILRSARQNL